MLCCRLKVVFRPFINFYRQLTCPDYNATTDVYAPMFACDFINFLIVMFGYQAFGPSVSTDTLVNTNKYTLLKALYFYT